VADNPRIEELRRRVQNDPASIAFAQLAEEYRRAGSYEEAIGVCRAGLSVHPGYLSARVTLGRALIEMNDLDAAQSELDDVLRAAPENLAAIRGLAEIHHRSGRLDEALVYYQAALALARHDPDLEETVDQISRVLTPERPVIADGLSFEQASAEFLSALATLPGENPPVDVDTTLENMSPAESHVPDAGERPPRTVEELERFLDAIHMYRQRRAV
jgi:tetratricopeptide (TPR) repeat protein